MDRRTKSERDRRDISAELDFRRSINGSSCRYNAEQQNSYSTNDEDNNEEQHHIMKDMSNKVFGAKEDGSDLETGKLVCDEELIRLGYIRNPLLYKTNNAFLDNDDTASVESRTDVDIKGHEVQIIAGRPQYQFCNNAKDKHDLYAQLDHRLNYNNRVFSSDETIQKRLERAIHSNENILKFDYVGGHNDASNMNNVSASCHVEDELVTMVKEFSEEEEDLSDESFSSSSKDLSIEVEVQDRSIDEQNDSKMVQKKFQNLSSDESFSVDTAITEDKENCNSVFCKNSSYSFDSDCSFLPDDDFETANWDSD